MLFCLSVFRSSTTTGGARFFFISNKSFVIGSGDCVHKKDWDRLTATAGAGWQRALLVCLRFVLGVFFIVCALLPSAPFVPLRLWRTASQGRGGQGGLRDGC